MNIKISVSDQYKILQTQNNNNQVVGNLFFLACTLVGMKKLAEKEQENPHILPHLAKLTFHSPCWCDIIVCASLTCSPTCLVFPFELGHMANELVVLP